MNPFRSAETAQIARLILAGASASFVGVSGIGKSNLFNHLVDYETRQQLFGPQADNILFIRVNFHFLDEQDITLRNIFSLILEQIEILVDRPAQASFDEAALTQIEYNHHALIQADNGDTAKIRYHFNQAIRQLMRHPRRKLVFLFDQFETVFQQGRPRIFLSLRGLRENYKYRISFLTFTRNALPVLAKIDPAREEFYELVAPNLIGLKPYTKQDALNMLQKVAARYRTSYSAESAAHLYSLVGGHAGTLRAAYLAHINGAEMLNQADLLAHDNISAELEKIWQSLSEVEQRTLHHAATQTYINALDPNMVHLLTIKGLLTGKCIVSSPLLKTFVSRQKLPKEAPIRFDKATLRILVNGRPTEQLTPLEHRIFMRLYNYAGEVVERDEIVNAGWPDAQGGITNETVNQAISRIRQKIRAIDKHNNSLKTVRGQGYRLDG